jgi:hypothetical protein
MNKISALLACLLLTPAVVPGATDYDDEVYKEDAIKHHTYKPAPGSEWKEQGLVLPPYPGDDALISIEVGRPDYPYMVFVDDASLSVGKDRVVRYTVVLRSKTGVDNVSFEGILCNQLQYKRYAYGANGRFHTLPVKDWAYIRSRYQDIYRAVLAEEFFCPLPVGDILAEIRYKLKSGSGTRDDRYLSPGDED